MFLIVMDCLYILCSITRIQCEDMIKYIKNEINRKVFSSQLILIDVTVGLLQPARHNLSATLRVIIAQKVALWE